MLGEDCRAWRLERGLTQLDIARAGHCTKNLVCLFETGKRRAPGALRGFLRSGYPLTREQLIEYLEVGHGREEA